MKTHDLKTWPRPFEAVIKWQKNFELRVNDRDFSTGDTLVLREYNPDKQIYTGRQTVRKITFILRGGEWDLPAHLSILGWGLPNESMTNDKQACGTSCSDCEDCRVQHQPSTEKTTSQ